MGNEPVVVHRNTWSRFFKEYQEETSEEQGFQALADSTARFPIIIIIEHDNRIQLLTLSLEDFYEHVTHFRHLLSLNSLLFSKNQCALICHQLRREVGHIGEALPKFVIYIYIYIFHCRFLISSCFFFSVIHNYKVVKEYM